jgi:hypothetical protein
VESHLLFYVCASETDLFVHRASNSLPSLLGEIWMSCFAAFEYLSLISSGDNNLIVRSASCIHRVVVCFFLRKDKKVSRI